MSSSTRGRIGFSCAYTPLPAIAAAGFVPHRILPLSASPDQAGRYLHDNLCPHVKRLVDRAMDDDLPPMAGMVVVNSCDAMRRLADAWRHVRPKEPVFLLDLPATGDAAAVAFFATEIERLAQALDEWGGRALETGALKHAADRYNQLGALFATLRQQMVQGRLPGGRARLQVLYNRATEMGPAAAADMLAAELDATGQDCGGDGVPIYLFGNVLADPEAFALIEAGGARVVGDDFCTGSRLFSPVEISGGGEGFKGLARSLLKRPPCARTFMADKPGALVDHVLAGAAASAVRGVIGHTLKFCDPYLARLPIVRDALRDAGSPLLLLEGDCSLGSIGQQRTRIEAFIEMLR